MYVSISLFVNKRRMIGKDKDNKDAKKRNLLQKSRKIALFEVGLKTNNVFP